jgi:metal-sulfur cluster biosynthetic enzyme
MTIVEDITEALKGVKDPEIGLDVVTIELIRDVKVEDSKALITMTLTSPQCPYGPMLMDDVKNTAKNIDGIEEAEIELTFSPPWEPSEELRSILGV